MLQPIHVLPATEVAPDAEALWTDERSLSWVELEERSRRFAQGLRALGVDEDETWAVLARNRFEWAEMSIGNGRAGTRYVPLNWHLTAAEITELLEDSHSKLLVVAPDLVDVGKAADRDLDLRGYMTMLYDPPVPEMIRPEATAVAAAASAAGYGVSVLTNDMRAFHGRDWEHDVAFLQLVDHIVDCSDTDILKPDPRAFQRAVDIVDVDTSRVLFVDDQPLNVDGANAFGLRGLWFDIANAADAWSDVAHRLGLSP